MIHDKIKADLKTAMLAKNQMLVNTLRGLLAAFTNELVAKRRKPTEILGDGEALAVIRRAGKQRQDAIEQFRAGNREDLVKAEEAELAEIQKYLPTQMNEIEVEKIVATKIKELGITDKKEMGKLIGTLMKDLKDRASQGGRQADGTLVKKVVEKLLS